MSHPNVQVIHYDGDIVEIQMARAPVNALDPQLCDALTATIAEAASGGAKGLVLSGNSKVFSAGLDVPHLLSLGDDRAALMDAWESFFRTTRALAGSPVPVVAAVTGHAPAGGCVLALSCDYRLMAKSADPAKPFRLGLNETQVGLVAPEGVQYLLQRAVGRQRGQVMLMTSELVDAQRALDIGLVDELAAPEDVTARAVGWLQSLLKLPREPVLRTRMIARADVIAALAPERIQLDRFIDAWTAPDTQAGLRALVARLGK
ncbi:enoyl-CoA hydratase/isomerase family protein [Lysobacter fragariae]